MNETPQGSKSLRVPGRKVCAVCAAVLDLQQGKGYAHPISLGPEPDHLAVPVDDTEVLVNPKCDFCFIDSTEWVLPAADFVMPPANVFQLVGSTGDEGVSLYESHGDWGACDPCAQLILGNQWAKVLRRVQAVWPLVHSGNLMDQEGYVSTYRLFRELRKNVAGPLMRIGDDEP